MVSVKNKKKQKLRKIKSGLKKNKRQKFKKKQKLATKV